MGKLPGLPSLSWNAYTDFAMKKFKIIDGNKIKVADSDRIFVFVNGKNEEGANSSLSLVRYEFLEIIFRLALRRYYESKHFPFIFKIN